MRMHSVFAAADVASKKDARYLGLDDCRRVLAWLDRGGSSKSCTIEANVGACLACELRKVHRSYLVTLRASSRTSYGAPLEREKLASFVNASSSTALSGAPRRTFSMRCGIGSWHPPAAAGLLPPMAGGS